MSLRPSDSELLNLKERVIRSERASHIQGQGIGLYLANYICELNDIDLKIELGKNREYFNQDTYSDFIATLTFNEIIHVDNKEIDN
ncbi:MAG: hypothetical protein WCG08_11710 [Paludibacter sp.]